MNVDGCEVVTPVGNQLASKTTRYKHHRFPAEFIAHEVWLNLSVPAQLS